MNDFNFIDLFAGIGGIRIPFEKLGGTCMFSAEWDKYAQQTYAHNFGETPAGDITKIDESDIPDHDILLAGFPCQPFSIIGDKQGFEDTRGTLFFDIVRILKKKQPRAFLLENVKQLLTHDKGQTFAVIQEQLSRLGYTTYHEVLNALDFGLPQKRERIFIVGFREPIAFAFPKPIGAYKPLSEVLEPDEMVEPSLFASERIQKSRREKCKGTPFFPSIWHENKGGNISVLPFSCALRAGASYNYLLVNGIRRLSRREMLRLQGFPEDFEIIGNTMQIRKQTGNSVAVPVVHAIAEKMLQALRQRKPMIRLEEQLLLFENRINAYTHSADRIIIVCKESEKDILVSVLQQFGSANRIQSIITEDELDEWYEKALRGQSSELIGTKILQKIANEIKVESPSTTSEFDDFFKERGYDQLSPIDFW